MTDVSELVELAGTLIDAARAYEAIRVAMNYEQESDVFAPAQNIAAEAIRNFGSVEKETE